MTLAIETKLYQLKVFLYKIILQIRYLPLQLLKNGKELAWALPTEIRVTRIMYFRLFWSRNFRNYLKLLKFLCVFVIYIVLQYGFVVFVFINVLNCIENCKTSYVETISFSIFKSLCLFSCVHYCTTACSSLCQQGFLLFQKPGISLCT